MEAGNLDTRDPSHAKCTKEAELKINTLSYFTLYLYVMTCACITPTEPCLSKGGLLWTFALY